MRANPVVREQACALHLLDLCRAHPTEAAARQAAAVLETYRLRGAEARKQDELRAAQAKERSARLAMNQVLRGQATETDRDVEYG